MITKELENFRAARRRSLTAIRVLSQEQTEFAPPGRWSAGEIFDHLLASERTWRTTLARLIELEKSGRVPVIVHEAEAMKTPLGTIPKQAAALLTIPMTMMNMMVPAGVTQYLLRNRLFAAQAPKSIQPSKGRSVVALERDLIESLERTEALLAANPGANWRRLCALHPVLGRVTAPGLLAMLAAHEDRHLKQLRELLASAPVTAEALTAVH